MNTAAHSFSVTRSTRASQVAIWLSVLAAFVVLSVPFWGQASFMRWAVEVMCFLVLAQM